MAANDNFEQSLRLIQKVEGTPDKIDAAIVAKIYLNLAIIASQTGDHQKALYFHEKCLEYKMKSLRGNMNNE